ncbi:LppU/SCO3897 family protein [Amycolatopsis jejuensis]|uniref:LppU/SCO3897 family protein n=1 Tax=Amycolatopsis jejuensis TaxID=330084 RepID=UPI000524614E|nr:hypothetical protein [Amycolatopsis jejuensis]
MFQFRKAALAGLVVLAGVVSCSVPMNGRASPASAPPAAPRATHGSKVDTLADVQVGDCLEFLDRGPADVEVGTIACTQPAAVYEVAVKLPSPGAKCPSDRYDTYQQTGRDEFTLCLMLNAKPGDCFVGLLAGATGPERTDCAKADDVVTTVIPDRADEHACRPGTELPLAYPVPAPGRTVCVGRQQSG